VILATAGARTRRNLAALALAVGGVAALTDIRLAGQPAGFAFAFANCALFMLYVVLGHRIANGDAPAPATAPSPATPPSPGTPPVSGIDQLGLAMLIAAAAATPAGIGGAWPAFTHPAWLLWGLGVGVCSSVIPYVTDQLAMAQLSRSTYSLMVSLLPAIATLVGVVVLAQLPSIGELVGVALVISGVAMHQDLDQDARSRLSTSAEEYGRG
jgi:inner membrane transporter RhtA